MRRSLAFLKTPLLVSLTESHATDAPAKRTSIIIILADHIGVGEFSAPRDDTARASCGNGAKANSYHLEKILLHLNLWSGLPAFMPPRGPPPAIPKHSEADDPQSRDPFPDYDNVFTD